MPPSYSHTTDITPLSRYQGVFQGFRCSSTLGPVSSAMAEMRESKTLKEQQLAEVQLNRELVWSDLPHMTREGIMGFLELREAAFLERALTNKEARPHLVKSYKDLVSPSFNQHIYISEDDFRALRWVMKRGINLRGFRLELKYSSGHTVRKSGAVLIGLMQKGCRYHNMKIAEYYATRGKLTNLDANHRGYTALTYASVKGHLNMVEALLAAGADKDGANRDGTTPLICAAQNGHVECLKVLLSAGAAKDKANKYTSTALICASKNGHVECVKELLAVKADVNQSHSSGWTPLICASYDGHVEIVELLLAAGAKKDKITICGNIALTIATKRGHDEIVQLLQQAA